jgi:Spy/CpxP family protein refolding chaperone
MRMFRLALLLLFPSLVLRAQDLPSPPVPALQLLQHQGTLELDSAQAAKLWSLARAQSTTLEKATAAFLRAEADVIDALQKDDLLPRKAALQKRATVATDGELARVKAEREARAILTARQRDVIDSIMASPRAQEASRVALWRPIVAPAPMVAPMPAVSADSGEVRITVQPTYADSWIDGDKRGTGRKIVMLPAGAHEVRMSAVGCTIAIDSVDVKKGPPAVLNRTLTCGK